MRVTTSKQLLTESGDRNGYPNDRYTVDSVRKAHFPLQRGKCALFRSPKSRFPFSLNRSYHSVIRKSTLNLEFSRRKGAKKEGLSLFSASSGGADENLPRISIKRGLPSPRSAFVIARLAFDEVSRLPYDDRMVIGEQGKRLRLEYLFPGFGDGFAVCLRSAVAL